MPNAASLADFGFFLQPGAFVGGDDELRAKAGLDFGSASFLFWRAKMEFGLFKPPSVWQFAGHYLA